MAALASDRPIVVCCSVGVRSAARWRSCGEPVHAVVNLEGGLFQCALEGRSLIRQGEPTLLVHPYRPGWGWLLPAHSRGVKADGGRHPSTPFALSR